MFGTDRAIENFELLIYPITPSQQERFKAWGSVSYTTERDFRNVTEDDCIVFSLYVTPETFARYGAKIAHGLVDQIVLCVGAVHGFYSEWSPSISTRSVKVLATGDEQKVNLPADSQFQPPRLGGVGDAKLYINRRLKFATPKAPDAIEETIDSGTVRAVPQTQASALVDPQIADAGVAKTGRVVRRVPTGADLHCDTVEALRTRRDDPEKGETGARRHKPASGSAVILSERGDICGNDGTERMGEGSRGNRNAQTDLE
jgi:hypothetical protein